VFVGGGVLVGGQRQEKKNKGGVWIYFTSIYENKMTKMVKIVLNKGGVIIRTIE
jgi:hypothetical protein